MFGRKARFSLVRSGKKWTYANLKIQFKTLLLLTKLL